MDESDQNKAQRLLRCKLVVAYDGSRFKGFQRQSSGASERGRPASEQVQPPSKRRRLDNNHTSKKKIPLTIQECFEDAMEQYTELDRSQLRMRFAGRTDGGVHARGQVVAISLPESVVPPDRSELWKIRKSINSRLPDDISVESVSLLVGNSDFDPRKDAIKKLYSYTLRFRRKVHDANGEVLPICGSGPNCIRSALDGKTIWIAPWTLDDSNMERYCQQLTGEHDYSAFVHKRSRREKENILTVEKFTCERLSMTTEEAPILTVRFHVEAKGFRRGMVRNLVGFVVDLCRGQLSESIFGTIWSGTDEAAKAVNSAPPFGLCLEHVAYSATLL